MGYVTTMESKGTVSVCSWLWRGEGGVYQVIAANRGPDRVIREARSYTSAYPQVRVPRDRIGSGFVKKWNAQ